MAIPRRAISRAVLSCAWLGRPEAFLKIVEAQQKDAAGKKTETGSANTIKDAGTSEKK